MKTAALTFILVATLSAGSFAAETTLRGIHENAATPPRITKQRHLKKEAKNDGANTPMKPPKNNGGPGSVDTTNQEVGPSGPQPDIGAASATARRRQKLEDEIYAEEWAEQYYQVEAAEADAAETDGDTAVWFDDDKYKEYEVATKKNFWSMFNNPPASWTARQWGFFAGVLTVFSIVFCCILKVFCPFG
mmetsp:Transcript_2597/g.4449  ORF Transcript_2597/g.4449 Transcript_2597/m.4449 type:complete len:190 (-) Transcript_2597:203-772(-)